MSIETWWPALKPSTREDLIANNGDAVSVAVREEIAACGGPGPSDDWWVTDDDAPEPRMPDAAIDWIEAVANDETPA